MAFGHLRATLDTPDVGRTGRAVVNFGKKSTSTDGWVATPAEIRDVKYGLVHETDSGLGGAYDKLSASKKVSLLVEPPGLPPYEATLKIDRDGPSTPDVPGARFDVLVDPGDPQRVALPADPTYTLPGGGTWAPEHGLAGALAEASRRGDAQEIMRLTAQIKASAPPTGASSGGAEDHTIGQLERLSKLHDSGALTDEEFAAQKAKVLGSG